MDSNKLIIGLTGGIGSGKTQVSDRFAALGITVVDTDLIARQVVQPNTLGLAAIIEHFGPELLTSDGQLDRAALRQRVFTDESQRQWLNQLLHPLIQAEAISQCQAASSPYVLLVVPLLLEGDMHQLVARILVIDVDRQTQIDRTCARDNNNPSLVNKIIDSQISRAQRLARADDIIDNSGDIAELDSQVLRLHQQYLALSEN
ncbi:dephospho-CoA kinase [Ferrimonas senticii]|uniref:dephospho-CoA kinase n=1 Tax=Ferrimonas senticii TaxID=394566 RepID=UPI0004282D20|nr:dephospho-CoA kinase [Ferrimonas senticii]